MYELFTKGQIPYATLASQQMLEFLEAGKRLEQPNDTNEEL